ncbi:peptidoglycan-binding domain-containing protein [Candidatus Thiosymbion oneisti]|uniref:peptidoglycan-binding domain-containing protein n=1 Tax=Candidatus Thiosymbion oneisti TaxID=589554 RepID=UPI00159F0C21|nr:peptidoglycan-binding domain-containing protein [Candidatus Thiosymbion oneisti]
MKLLLARRLGLSDFDFAVGFMRLVFAVAILGSSAAQGKNTVALDARLMRMDAYEHWSDYRAPSDAAGKLESTLQSQGFKLKQVISPKLDQMVPTVQSWPQGVARNSEVLVIFSGIVAAMDGKNFLLPQDFNPRDRSESIDRRGFSLARMVNLLARRRPTRLVVIVDGCRGIQVQTRTSGGTVAAGVDPGQDFSAAAELTALSIIFADSRICRGGVADKGKDLLSAVTREITQTNGNLDTLAERLELELSNRDGVTPPDAGQSQPTGGVVVPTPPRIEQPVTDPIGTKAIGPPSPQPSPQPLSPGGEGLLRHPPPRGRGSEPGITTNSLSNNLGEPAVVKESKVATGEETGPSLPGPQPPTREGDDTSPPAAPIAGPPELPPDDSRPSAQEPEIAPSEPEASLGLTRQQRCDAQLALKALGFDPKGVDGTFGKNTRAAIARFQKAHGFDQTGYLSGQQRDLLLELAKEPLARLALKPDCPRSRKPRAHTKQQNKQLAPKKTRKPTKKYRPRPKKPRPRSKPKRPEPEWGRFWGS